MKSCNNKSKNIAHVSLSDHVQNKSMWLGSHSPTNINYYIIDDNKMIKKKKITITPSLIKLLDELLVNALDHYWELLNEKGTKKVSEIKVNYYRDRKSLEVYNNGDGFCLMKDETGKTKAELVFTQERTGSNVIDNKEKVVGGTNGFGIKLISCMTDKFFIETVDHYQQSHLRMLIENNAKKIGTPLIASAKKNQYPFSRIKLLPSYDKMGYKNISSSDIELINSVFMSRTYFASYYLDVIGKKKCKVYYNNLLIDTVTFEQFLSDKLGIDKFVMCRNEKPDIINIAVTNKQISFNMINGIMCDGGNHLNNVIQQIADSITKKSSIVNKKLQNIYPDENKRKIYITRCIKKISGYVFIGQIRAPEWVGQTKNEVKITKQKQAQISLTKKNLDDVVSFLLPPFIETIKKEYIKLNKNKAIKKNLSFDKYHKAKYANEKKGHECSLFIVEGDSARLMINKVIESPKNDLNYNYCGVYNIQGVPHNARKMIAHRDDNIVIPNNKLLADKVKLNELAQIIGLDYAERNPDKTKLNYGKIVIAVDQDQDGIGKIFSLISNYFELYWPDLVKDNFIFRIDTPVVRVYERSKKIKEFYSEQSFWSWFNSLNLKERQKLDIKYYKGLAAHDKYEVNSISLSISNHYREYFCDNKSREFFDMYYCKETIHRKHELIKGLLEIKDDFKSRISFSNHLQGPVKNFMLEENKRKIPNVFDGLVPSKRKVLASLRKNSTKVYKTFQLAGLLAQEMHYHHGSHSIEEVISRMAQTFIGTNNLPLLTPKGDFGNRSQGQSIFGQPRYTSVCLNKKLTDKLFPRADDQLLQYVIEDGEICEPEYYVPVLPLAILENNQCTGSGWKFDIWGRDVYVVKNIVTKMIRDEEHLIPQHVFDKKLWIQRRFDEEGKLIDNFMEMRPSISKAYGLTEFCFGKYHLSDGIIYVNELPICIWTLPYIEKIRKKEYIKKVEMNKGTDIIDVVIHLTPGSLDNILKNYGNPYEDPIEEYLLLRRCTRSLLNFMNDVKLLEFGDNFMEVIKCWFDMRKKIYLLRIERKIILIKLRATKYKNIIRYTNDEPILSKKYDNKKELCDALTKNGYQRINDAKLSNNDFIENSKLNDTILNDDENGFNYLINMRQIDLVKSRKQKNDEQLDKINQQLKYYESLDWRDLWIQEIDDLMIEIDNGINRGWMN
jgi:DNA topoisomerase II